MICSRVSGEWQAHLLCCFLARRKHRRRQKRSTSLSNIPHNRWILIFWCFQLNICLRCANARQDTGQSMEMRPELEEDPKFSKRLSFSRNARHVPQVLIKINDLNLTLNQRICFVKIIFKGTRMRSNRLSGTIRNKVLTQTTSHLTASNSHHFSQTKVMRLLHYRKYSN